MPSDLRDGNDGRPPSGGGGCVQAVLVGWLAFLALVCLYPGPSLYFGPLALAAALGCGALRRRGSPMVAVEAAAWICLLVAIASPIGWVYQGHEEARKREHDNEVAAYLNGGFVHKDTEPLPKQYPPTGSGPYDGALPVLTHEIEYIDAAEDQFLRMGTMAPNPDAWVRHFPPTVERALVRRCFVTAPRPYSAVSRGWRPLSTDRLLVDLQYTTDAAPPFNNVTAQLVVTQESWQIVRLERPASSPDCPAALPTP